MIDRHGRWKVLVLRSRSLLEQREQWDIRLSALLKMSRPFPVKESMADILLAVCLRPPGAEAAYCQPIATAGPCGV